MTLVVDFNLSPRIITVESPTTDITIQTIINEIRDIEDELKNLSFPKLLSAAGKEELGGGVTVGITATLQNAQLRFEDRFTSVATGTCTTDDLVVLIDASATFISSGVNFGATVGNLNSGGVGSVKSVDSETQLTITTLVGGTDTKWDVGDKYKIFNTIQCSVSGGNLVAVDTAGAELDPISPSAYTQVVRTSSSSATLQELSSIQYSSFNNSVTIDILNGIAGTEFPIGTTETPVNNVDDAKLIADARGFEKFHIHGDLTLVAGNDVSGYVFEGHGYHKTLITVDSAAITLNCDFEECEITGRLGGNNEIIDCRVNNLTAVNGEAIRSRLMGTLCIDGGLDAIFMDCGTAIPGIPVVIDMGGSGQNAMFHDWSGGVNIINMNGISNMVRIQIDGGKVLIDSSVTAGYVIVVGIGIVEDNSGDNCTVNTQGLMSRETISETIWDEPTDNHKIAGTFGNHVSKKLLTVAKFIGLK